MSYLTCGRCGLEIKIQAAFLRIESCPRCLARGATVAPMVLSTSPAVAWGSATYDRVSGPREGRGISGGDEHAT